MQANVFRDGLSWPSRTSPRGHGWPTVLSSGHLAAEIAGLLAVLVGNCGLALLPYGLLHAMLWAKAVEAEWPSASPFDSSRTEAEGWPYGEDLLCVGHL